MKNITLGIFSYRHDAERAMEALMHEAGIERDDISYLYRNVKNTLKPAAAGGPQSKTIGEGVTDGVGIGAVLGGIAGIAVAAGVLPTLAPLLVAGPLAAMIGLTGTAGTVATGTLSGVALGALSGALAHTGIDEERARRYENEVKAGKILIAVHGKENVLVEHILADAGASEVDTFSQRS